jgi:outer membrane protein TolC
LADAKLLRSTAARSLETLSGTTPTAVTAFPEDDLRPEGALEGWLAAKDTPSDRVQSRLNAAALSGKQAAASALLPTLSANAQERITNATGFGGRSDSYTLQAVLSWRLDYGTYATAEAQAAASDAQQIRSERSRRNTEDTVFDAYHRVEAGIVKSRAARAQAKAADNAAQLASERYRAGALTQLDVTQSQRDAFGAQAARIQADADLAYARVLLRTAAGRPPVDAHPRALPQADAPSPAAPAAPAPPEPQPMSL